MERDDKLFKVYEQIFQTWRWQVDSYWQRSNYFAAFETAAIAGCWLVLTAKDRHIWAGSILSGLGVILTIAWFYNNHKTHKYISHWWESLRKLETNEKIGLESLGVNFVTQQEGGGFPPYHCLPQIVAAIFMGAWLILFVWSLLLPCACPRH
jgi:hypothetical protein